MSNVRLPEQLRLVSVDQSLQLDTKRVRYAVAYPASLMRFASAVHREVRCARAFRDAVPLTWQEARLAVPGFDTAPEHWRNVTTYDPTVAQMFHRPVRVEVLIDLKVRYPDYMLA